MMQRQIKGRVCMAFFLMTAPAIFFESAWADDLRKVGCEVGGELAGKIYNRIAAAKKEKNEYVVFENRIFFWEVFKYSKHCEGVSKMAIELTRNGLGGDDRMISFDNPIPPMSLGDANRLCVRTENGLILCPTPPSSGMVGHDRRISESPRAF